MGLIAAAIGIALVQGYCAAPLYAQQAFNSGGSASGNISGPSTGATGGGYSAGQVNPSTLTQGFGGVGVSTGATFFTAPPHLNTGLYASSANTNQQNSLNNAQSVPGTGLSNTTTVNNISITTPTTTTLQPITTTTATTTANTIGNFGITQVQPLPVNVLNTNPNMRRVYGNQNSATVIPGINAPLYGD